MGGEGRVGALISVCVHCVVRGSGCCAFKCNCPVIAIVNGLICIN